MQSHYTIPTIGKPSSIPSGIEPDLRPSQGRVRAGTLQGRSLSAVDLPGVEPGLHGTPYRHPPVGTQAHRTQTVPRPGIEPGPRPSESRVMTVSLPGHRGQWPERGSNPHASRHGLLRTACTTCFTTWPSLSPTVDRGGSRTLISWLQASCLPVRRHAQDLRH
jgi:hypothetical protein